MNSCNKVRKLKNVELSENKDWNDDLKISCGICSSRRTASNLIDLLHHIIRQPIKSDQYEYQAFIFCMLLIAFSSCSKPGYEKAIAEWVQDRFSRHLDGFKVRTTGSVGNRRRHRIGQPVLPEQQKAHNYPLSYRKAESPVPYSNRPFPPIWKPKKPESNGCHESHVPTNRDSTEVIGKILKCRYAIVQPHSGCSRKDGFFPIVPDMENVSAN